MANLDPLKFAVEIAGNAMRDLDDIKSKLDDLKNKTITVDVNGLTELRQLLSALRTLQVGNLGKDVASGITDAANSLKQEAQDAVRTALGQLAKDLVNVKTAIQNDNFTAFSKRIEKCAEAVNTLDAAFKNFHVTIGQDEGMKNFMTGLGEVIRNVRTTMGVLNEKNGASLLDTTTLKKSVNVAEHEMKRLDNLYSQTFNAIATYSQKGFNTTALERYEKEIRNVHENLLMISKNSGIHPLTGMTATQYLSTEDANRSISLLKTELHYYQQIEKELEKMAGLRSTLNSLLRENPTSSYSGALREAIEGLSWREGIVHRLKTSEAVSHLNSGEYRNQIHEAVSLISKVSAESRQSKKDNDALVESMRKAGIAVSDLAAKFDKLEVAKIRANAVKANVDTSAYDQAVERMDRYKRVLEYINEKGGHDASRILGSVGYRNASNDLNIQAAALKALTTDANQAAASAQRLTDQEQKLAQAIVKSTSEMFSQSHVLSDLKSMATQYLGVWGAQQFINNIIQIGGQLEMQRLSIAAILGDAAQANDLFEKIKGLAIQSPFGVVELDQMTKQLTAYGFEYHELFDMTKRLADISAATGTGVDRLALALGHVRSEAALSGYTLRQFSMANIPLAQKLSDRLSEIEKRFVSVAEVRKRVSKKEIGYEDVVAVLKELTDEGGMFYNAQEIMSGSVKAKFKNLKDAMDIMYGEMAESKLGEGLKEVATILTTLTREWEKLGVAIATVAGIWAIKKGATFLSSSAMLAYSDGVTRLKMNLGSLTAEEMRELAYSNNLTKQRLLEAVATGKVTVEDAKLAAAKWNLTEAQLQEVAMGKRTVASMTANSIATSKYSMAQLRAIATTHSHILVSKSMAVAWNVLATNAKMAGAAILGFAKAAWPIALITAGVEAWMHYRQQSEQAGEAASSAFTKGEEAVRNLKEALDKLPTSVGLDDGALRNGIKEAVKELKNYNPAIVNDIIAKANKTGSDGKPIMNLAEQYDYLRGKVEETRKELEEFQRTSSAQESALKATGGVMNDNVFGDINDYFNARKEFIEDTNDFYAEYKARVRTAVDAAREEDDAFRKRTDAIDNYAERMRVLVTESDKFPKAYNVFWGSPNMQTTDFRSKWGGVLGKGSEMTKELDNWANGLKATLEGSFGYDFSLFGKDFSEKTRTELNNVRRHIWEFTESEELSKLDEETRKWIRDYLGRKWNITFSTNTEQVLKEFDEMQHHIEGLVGKDWVIRLKLQSVGSYEELYDQLNKDVKDAKETMRKLGTGFTKERKAVLESLVTDEQFEGEEKEYRDAYLTLLKSKEAAEKKNWKLDALEDKKSGGRKSTEDVNAKAVRERVRIIKEAADAFQYWRQKVGDKGAWAHVEAEFGNVLNDIDVTAKNVDDLKGNLEKTLTSKEFNAIKDEKVKREIKKEVAKDTAQIERKEFEKTTDEFASKVQIELDSLTRAWEIFNNVRDATGDVELAVKISGAEYAGGKTRNLADALREKIQRDFDAASGGIAFDINLSDKQIEEAIKNAIPKASEIQIKGLVDEYKKWRDLQRDVLKSDIDVFDKLIGSAVDLQSQLRKVTDEYAKQIAALDELKKSGKITNGQYNQAKAIADANLQMKTVQAQKEYQFLMNGIVTMSKDAARDVKRNFTDALKAQLKAGAITAKEYADKIEDINKKMQDLENAPSYLQSYMEGGLNGVFDNLINRGKGMVEQGASNYQSAVQSYNNAKPDLANGNMGNLSQMWDAAQAKESASSMMQMGEGMQQMGGEMKQTIAVIDMIVHGIDNVVQGLKNTYDQIKEMYESLGYDTEGGSWGNASTFLSSFSNASSNATKGWEGLKNGDIGGMISGVVGSWTSWITGFAKGHDAKRDYQIRLSEEQLKVLQSMDSRLETIKERSLGYAKSDQKTLDKFSEDIENWQRANQGDLLHGSKKGIAAFLGSNIGSIAGGFSGDPVSGLMTGGVGALIGGIFGSGRKRYSSYLQEDTVKEMEKAIQSGSAYQAEYASLLRQRDEINHQLESEKDKKDSSSDAIAEYESQLDELDDKIKNFTKDLANELYGIDLKGWSDQISDALWTAFENGEDAVKAFGDVAKDIVSDVAERMMNIHLIEPAMSSLEEKLFGKTDSNGNRISSGTYDSNTGMFNETETLKILGDFFGENGEFAKVIGSAEQFYKMAEQATGMNFSSDESSSSSKLISGGFSEQETGLLLSYVNTIRADVSIKREYLMTITQDYLPSMLQSMTAGVDSLASIEQHTSAMVRMMEIYSQNIAGIHEILDDARGSSGRGLYVKVYSSK